MLTAKQKASAILKGTPAKNIPSLIETASIIANEFKHKEVKGISNYIIPNTYIEETLTQGCYIEAFIIAQFFDSVFASKRVGNITYYLARLSPQVIAITYRCKTGDIIVTQGLRTDVGNLWDELL